MPLPLKTLKFFAPTLLASKDANGKLMIEGVASSTIKDRHGDQLTLSALRRMQESAVGMTIFMNHEYRVPQDVFGTVESTKLVKTKDLDKAGQPIYDLRFGIRAAESNEEAVKTWRLINEDAIKLGLSIGAMVPEGGAAFDTATKSYVISDIDVVETSVIGIPANPRSFVDYVVKAFSGRFPDRLSDERRGLLAKEIGSEVDIPDDADEQAALDAGLEGGFAILEGTANTGVEVPSDGSVGVIASSEVLPMQLLAEAIDEWTAEEHFDTGGLDLVVKESWSSAYVSALPASAFACPGPRKYPHHNKGGAVDLAHLRAALSRVGDPENDQCGKAHLEAHARKLGIGDTEKSLDLEKDGSGQHPHAHIHEHDHEHGYGDTLTAHNHEHAHVHSHEHDGDHEHASDQNDYQHDHQHDGSYGDPDHAHEGTDEQDPAEKTEKSLDPAITKTTVAVWESQDGNVIEVNTGRAKPKGDGQAAQTGSDTAAADTTKALEDDEKALVVASATLDGASGMLKAVYAQLTAAKAENVVLKSERDAALGIAATAMDSTQALLAKLAEMPMGRKTYVADITEEFGGLRDIYGADVRKLMQRK